MKNHGGPLGFPFGQGGYKDTARGAHPRGGGGGRGRLARRWGMPINRLQLYGLEGVAHLAHPCVRAPSKSKKKTYLYKRITSSAQLNMYL